MIYALIPARGGSQRIPRKNMEKVGGQTLVARAVRAAMDSSVDRVYVSTEDPEIAEEARRSLAYVIERPEKLARSDIPMELVVGHFIVAMNLKGADIVVILEPTAPLRESADIEAALVLMQSSAATAVRLVAKMGTGCHPVQYRDAGLCNAIRVRSFILWGCLFPPHTVLLHRGDERAIDVDTMAELEQARAAVAR